MIELLRSNDPVFLSWLQAALTAEGIGFAVFDAHMSIVEGSLGILPRRIMVHEEDEARARMVLAAVEAGGGENLGDDAGDGGE